MLDFIVLGLVPGTSFVVTFNWVLGFASVLLATAVIKKLDEQRTNEQPTCKQQAAQA